MNIYPPDSIDESKYAHLEQSDLKKIFCTYLTFNKTTLEWYGGETTLNKYLKGYAGSGPSIIKHFREWKEKLGDNWRDNFICFLDECFETKIEAKSREGELVNNETRDELCINILNDGGGWDYGDEYPEEVAQKISKKRIGKYAGKNHPQYGKPNIEAKQRMLKNNPVSRPEVREKISKTIILKQYGKNHPRYIPNTDPKILIDFIKKYNLNSRSKYRNKAIEFNYPTNPMESNFRRTQINNYLGTNLKTLGEFIQYVI